MQNAQTTAIPNLLVMHCRHHGAMTGRAIDLYRCRPRVINCAVYRIREWFPQNWSCGDAARVGGESSYAVPRATVPGTGQLRAELVGKKLCASETQLGLAIHVRKISIGGRREICPPSQGGDPHGHYHHNRQT